MERRAQQRQQKFNFGYPPQQQQKSYNPYPVQQQQSKYIPPQQQKIQRFNQDVSFPPRQQRSVSPMTYSNQSPHPYHKYNKNYSNQPRNYEPRLSNNRDYPRQQQTFNPYSRYEHRSRSPISQKNHMRENFRRREKSPKNFENFRENPKKYKIPRPEPTELKLAKPTPEGYMPQCVRINGLDIDPSSIPRFPRPLPEEYQKYIDAYGVEDPIPYSIKHSLSLKFCPDGGYYHGNNFSKGRNGKHFGKYMTGEGYLYYGFFRCQEEDYIDSKKYLRSFVEGLKISPGGVKAEVGFFDGEYFLEGNVVRL